MKMSVIRMVSVQGTACGEGGKVSSPPIDDEVNSVKI
jgi:hypothetical protein